MIQPRIMSDSTSYAMAHDEFTRSRNLVIGYFADIIITDITAWAEKLVLCRNWASQTKPAIQYARIHNLLFYPLEHI